jgi:putative membrane protein
MLLTVTAGMGLCALSHVQAQNLSDQDRTFIQDAAKGGMLEVHMGQLASERAANPAVKSYGQRLVTDHAKANEELTSLASKKNVTLPPDDAQMATSLPIGQKSGADFDREFTKTAVEDHKKDIAMFEKEANSGGDPDVKDWANKTLPTLRAHLSDAEALSK